jgi:hypothetical protein
MKKFYYIKNNKRYVFNDLIMTFPQEARTYYKLYHKVDITYLDINPIHKILLVKYSEYDGELTNYEIFKRYAISILKSVRKRVI